MRAFYGRGEPGRPLCEMPKDPVVAENELAYMGKGAYR